MKSAYGVHEQEQLAALKEMEKLVLSMKFGDSSEKRKRRTMMPFQKGILAGIQSVILLFENLKKENFKFLMTTKVNNLINQNECI